MAKMCCALIINKALAQTRSQTVE
ncbi:rCG57702, partial [Rattus norvegicus]